MGISTSTGTLTAGQSRTFNLSPASAVTLTLSPNVRVTITETPATVAATGLGGNASRVHEPRLPGVVTYGPYPMGGSVLVENESNSGSSVAWVRSDSIVAESADGLSSLVSGDEEFALTQTYTWATLPAAADYIGTAHITDVGEHGSLWRSDGSTWGIVGGSVILGAYGADLTVTAASTAEVDLVTLNIPAGLIGLNGQLVVTHFWEVTNNANTKTARVKLGGTAFFANATSLASVAIFLPPPTVIWNRNSQSSQMAFAAANGNTSVATGTAKTTGTVDTSAATTLVISGQKATGSDTMTLLGYRVELVRP